MPKIKRQPMMRVRSKQIVGPLEACIRLERILRGREAYHYAMDVPTCKVGLGQWLKRVIRNAKRPNTTFSQAASRETAELKTLGSGTTPCER